MITGKAKCEFGTGDILITPICKCDLTKGAICLQNKGTHTIGEYSSTDNFCEEVDDTLLTFTKVESIDVLIERLEYLKAMMLGEVKCNKIYEYDY